MTIDKDEPIDIPPGVPFGRRYEKFAQSRYGKERVWFSYFDTIFPVFFDRHEASTAINSHIVLRADHNITDWHQVGQFIRDNLKVAKYTADFAIPMGGNVSGLQRLPLATFVVSLQDRNEENIFEGLSKTARNLVRRASKDFSINVVRGSFPNGLYAIYEETMRSHGTPPKSKNYFEQLIAAFADQCVFIIAEDGSGIQAFNCAVFDNDSCSLFVNSSTRTAKEKYVNYLLYWELLREASRLRVANVDLGGSSVGSADGSARFKLAFGAEEVPLYRLVSGSASTRMLDFISRKWRNIRLRLGYR